MKVTKQSPKKSEDSNISELVLSVKLFESKVLAKICYDLDAFF